VPAINSTKGTVNTRCSGNCLSFDDPTKNATPDHKIY
jgi:hypothetical protein